MASVYLFKPPYVNGSVPSLSGHVIAYRWRSLPRVRRHRVSKPQGVVPDGCYLTMDQLICASLSHTHYWHEVGMLKVSAVIWCVCVLCVFSSHPFWTSMDVPAGVTQEEGHTGFLIHLPSAVRALIFVARRIQPFLSLVDREVEFCVLTN